MISNPRLINLDHLTHSLIPDSSIIRLLLHHPTRSRHPESAKDYVPYPQPSCSPTAPHRRYDMVSEMLHKYVATLRTAVLRNRSRRLVKCAKDCGRYQANSAPNIGGAFGAFRDRHILFFRIAKRPLPKGKGLLPLRGISDGTLPNSVLRRPRRDSSIINKFHHVCMRYRIRDHICSEPVSIDRPVQVVGKISFTS